MSDVLVEYELVVPDGIVGCGVVVEEIGVAAGVLRGVAGRIRERSAAVVGVWGSLEGVYRTGDTGQLLSVMGPVGVRGDLVAWRCERVAGVLEDLAVAVVSPVGRLRELRAEAVEFLATIRGGRVVVTETVYSGTGTSFVSSGEVDWFDDPETAERNNRIIREINAEYVRLDQAQADAVNAISCVAAGSDRFGGGLGVGVYVPVGIDVLNAEGVPLPWGAATRAPTCNESVGFAIQRWGKGAVDGFAALFAGRDPVTGQHSWEVVGASWGAVGMTAAGVVLAANPATWATKGLYAAQQAVGVPLSDSQKADDDFINDALGHAGGLVAGFVDADMWGKNPTVAATTTVLNIGSVLVPGVDVLAGVKLAAGAARVGSLLERAAQFAGDAGAVSVKAALQNILKNTETLTTTIKNTNNTLTATMTEMVRKALTDLNEKLVIPRVEPTLPGTHPHNTPDHLTQVNTTTHETPPRNTTTDTTTDNNTTHTSGPGNDTTPNHTTTDTTHTDTTDTTHTDTTVSGDGQPNPGTKPHDNNSDSNSGDSNTGVGGGSAGEGHPGIGDIGDVGGEAIKGWRRVDDEDLSAPDYESPQADSGSMMPEASNRVTKQIQDMIIDAGAPHGRNKDTNDPLSLAEWESRFALPNTPNGDPTGSRFPGNDGAKPGTRIEYSDLDVMLRHSPELQNLDRIGHPGGKFLTIEGTPFEHRSLPPNYITREYHTYQLTGNLPDNVRAEVSIIDRGLGFPGGGLQLRFKDTGTGDWVSIADLISVYGVLKE